MYFTHRASIDSWIHGAVTSFIHSLFCKRFGLLGTFHQSCGSFLSAKDLLRWYMVLVVGISLHCLWSQTGLGKDR